MNSNIIVKEVKLSLTISFQLGNNYYSAVNCLSKLMCCYNFVVVV